MGGTNSDKTRLWGANRAVLYLPAAAKTLDAIDGFRVNGITNTIEKFLDSPESAWDKTAGEFVWQARHLDSNTRAFTTWCQNEAADCELLVVLNIYKKSNEDAYWADIGDYNEQGQRYIEEFASMAADGVDEWVEEVGERDFHRVRTSD